MPLISFLFLTSGDDSNNNTLGDTDFATKQEASARKYVNYIKWTDENRYSIGKYACEHGNTAAVRNF